MAITPEHNRLVVTATGTVDWQRWGTYVSDRARGTVPEDYNADGSAWEYVPHDHARSRAYRWNEDGLAGSGQPYSGCSRSFRFRRGSSGPELYRATVQRPVGWLALIAMTAGARAIRHGTPRPRRASSR